MEDFINLCLLILFAVAVFGFVWTVCAIMALVLCWALNASGIAIHFSWELVMAIFLFELLSFGCHSISNKNEKKEKEEEN